MTDPAHPLPQSRQHLLYLGLADAVHDRVVDIALEGNARGLPRHPLVERVVQEQIREHG